MDSYLECISKKAQDSEYSGEGERFSRSFDCNTIKPRDNRIDPQGVSLISVFQRCKANYQQKQWDEGAFLIHDPERLSRFIKGVPIPEALPSSSGDGGGVGSCLLKSSRDGGEGTLGCFQEYVKMPSAVYWKYDRLDVSSSSYDSADVDACIVFSGPSRSTTIHEETSLAFKRCSSDYTETGCRIPHMVWSSSSKNRVPVANLHMVDDSDIGGRESVAALRFR